MKQLSPRLWDGAAPEKCRYVSGMVPGTRPGPEAGRGLGAGYTVQRAHNRVLGWGGGSGDSVRFGGLGGLGGVWELAIQYRGIIRRH